MERYQSLSRMEELDKRFHSPTPRTSQKRNEIIINYKRERNMKKTIKQLEQEIETLNRDKDRWYSKFTDLKEEKDRTQNIEFSALRNDRGQLLNQVANLLEIIRWHINPSTAESPFLPTKGQREDRNNYPPLKTRR